MTLSEFFNKFKSPFLWGNIIAMIAVVVLLLTGVKIGLDKYTRHGETIAIPSVTGKPMTEARRILYSAGLGIEVSDTGYVKDMPADCVLEQKPAAGVHVKEGHTISLIVNASHTPTLALPDIIQNCSLREALARLKAMGFKVGEPQYVQGEKDWVYGVTVDGRHVATGDRIAINRTVVVQAGNGLLSDNDSVKFVDYHLDTQEELDEDPAPADEFDDFVEIQ